MKRKIESCLFWLLLIAFVGLLHWGLYLLLAYLFNHGSSAAFETGCALVVLDGIFWCAVYAGITDHFRKRKLGRKQ